MQQRGPRLKALLRISSTPFDVWFRNCTDQSSVSVVVHRLVDKGLVNRQESATDRRRAELFLSGAGRKLLSRVQTHSPQDRLIETIESMSARNRQQLATLLMQVVDGMA